jgi:hypothetical protein
MILSRSKNFSRLKVSSIAAIVFAVFAFAIAIDGQQPESAVPGFRLGERLTYTIAFERFSNVGYAEVAVVSRGKLGGRDALELHSRVKTTDILSAAFYNVDESRTVFLSTETGLPLYISKISNSSLSPSEEISNYLAAPPASADLLTTIFRIRNAAGQGSFTFAENDRTYTAILQQVGTEAVRVSVGQFDTTVSSFESEYLKELGISELRINFTADVYRVPVLIRFRTSKGQFRVELSSLQVKQAVQVQPTPVATPTPLPVATPKPVVTPTPYIDNQPLSDDLAFPLGETLDYRITTGGRPVATLRLQARERKQFQAQDSLLLTAEIIAVEPGVTAFAMGDGASAHVNPESLAPQQVELKFRGPLSNLDQTAVFDQRSGTVTYGGTNSVDVPIGTHSILSLIYALRSFNLKRSRDAENPVNDTRVAVFWGNRSLIFTLRPADAETIDVHGTKTSAQQIVVNTGDPQLDQLGIKIWLSNDEKRVPLRFQIGVYQADLFADTTIPPK